VTEDAQIEREKMVCPEGKVRAFSHQVVEGKE
jgi:hypothetical protein